MLLPVRNGASWLPGCLESLRAQSFADFEVLVLDHDSKDDSAAIASAFPLPRLRVLRAAGPSLGAVLALGVDAAEAEILLRVDVDDFPKPERFERQMAFMEARPDVVACGTWATVRVEGRLDSTVQRVPTSDAQIRLALHVGNPFLHSTMALRRHSVLRVGNYQPSPATVHAEDLDLWVRLSTEGELANLPAILVTRNDRDDSVMRAHGREVNASGGRLLAALWSSCDLPQVAQAADLAPAFLDRRGRLSIPDAWRLFKALVALRKRYGWWAGRGSWPVDTWLRPVAWALASPRVRRP